MVDFLTFWWGCVRDGWQVGDGFFGFLEIFTFVVSNFLRGRQRWAKHVEPWEKLAMKATFRIFMVSFIVSTVFVAPFLKYKEAENNNPKADEKIVRWRPQTMNADMPIYVVLFGGFWSPNGITGTPQSIPFNTKASEQDTEITLYWASVPQNKYKAITAQIIKGKLFLNLEIPTKEEPVELKAGESTPLPKGWDWNSDANSLEIVDDQRQAVFQEIFVQTNFVWIRGAIQLGGQVLMTSNFGEIRTEQHGVYNVSDIGLDTRFKYPSSEHPGQLIERDQEYAP